MSTPSEIIYNIMRVLWSYIYLRWAVEILNSLLCFFLNGKFYEMLLCSDVSLSVESAGEPSALFLLSKYFI